jgi:amino acid adenylation domain-containing protein
VRAVIMLRPVSKNQERFLLAERFTPTNYGTRATYRLRGELDLDRLRRAIRATMASHPILRTEFHPQDGSFGARVRPEPDTVDLGEVTARTADPAEIQRLHVDHIFRKPATFSPRELIRAQVIHLPGAIRPGERLLTLSLHHALSDGLSITAYADEVLARYNGEAVPAAADYATLIDAAMASPDVGAQAEAARAYWLSLLEGVGEARGIPHDLDARVDLAFQRTGLIRLPFASFHAVGQALSASAFTVAAALSHVVLARYSGSDDLLSTFQSSGRRGLADDRVIGPFSNTLILRTRIEPGASFADLVAAQRQGIKGALAHESYPHHLVLRDVGLRPRFGLNWFPPYALPRIAGAEVLSREFILNQTDYELDLRFMVEGEDVVVHAFHDSGRHSAERIDAILADLASGLGRLAEDPRRALSTILDTPAPLVVPTPSQVPEGRLFDEVLARAREAPDRIALIGPDETLTFGQLDAASAALGRRLVAAGLGPGRRVAILAERGPQLVCSMLAVLRIGATMVPLDAEYPDERLRTLVGVAMPDALLMPRRGRVPGWAGGVPTVLFARDPRAPAVDPAAVPPEALAAGDPDDPAYILFTSGSTGTPKGLATSHRPPLNFLRWQREAFGITAEDRFTNLMGVAHDMMIRDVFAPLSVGARLAIPHQDDIFRSGRLLEWVAAQRPTVMHLTPAMGAILAAGRGPRETLPLRVMFFGGDRLLPALTASMAELAPDARIVNFYGATETPQAASFHVCEPRRPWRAHPIGRGIDNVALRIVGPDRQPVPAGAPGEIAVLTPFLSLGRVKGGDLVPHDAPGTYFTGDTGFELPSGEVMFTGRRDDQVKIRDFRVELGEVSRAIEAHPAVREAIVLAEGDEQPRLVAFAAGDDLSGDDLRAWAERRLPHYMVPAEVVGLDALPLLPNGKVDRQALLALPRERRTRRRGRQPETMMERKLAAIWAQHLEVDEVSPDQTFAELRGDSLTYVQVLLATEAEVGQLPDGWESLPLAEIAALRAPPPTFYKWVDSAMLVRATATALVVALHLGLLPLGGSTTALFMVSGFLLGRLQMAEAFQVRSAAPVWRTIGRILVPYLLYLALYAGAKLALGLPVHWSVLTLTTNFVDYREAFAADVEGLNIFLWYVDCLIQMLAIVALLLAANFRWRLTESPARFALALLAAGAVLRFGLPGLLDPGSLLAGIEAESRLAYLPTTHLAALALGMCIAQVRTLRAKAGLALVGAAFAAGYALTSESHGWVMLLIFGTLLLFVPRLPIPNGLHVVVLALSGSSLFIYLTHVQVGGVLQRLGVPNGSPLLWLLALASGVLLWLVWQRLADWRARSGELVANGLRSLWRTIGRT